MYNPVYSYSDNLVNSLLKIESLKTYLNALDLSYTIRHRLTMNAKTQDLFHFGHLLGLDMTLKDAERIAGGLRLEGFKDQNAYIINNFRNTLEFNRSNIADTYSEIDFTVLLHLNKLITSSWRESWDSRFRNLSDELLDEDEWIKLRDLSITGEQVQGIMIEFVEWYKSSLANVPPVIRIGVALYRLIEVAPFYAANYYSFVALADYLFYKVGLSSRSYSSFVRDFDVNRSKYIEAFNISKNSHDITFWLETLADSLIKELSEAKEGLGKFIEEEEKSKTQPFLDLNKRQLKVLRYLQSVPVIKREDYCHMMEVSTMTAFRDLNDLVRKKLIKVEGKGRGTKYRLSSM